MSEKNPCADVSAVVPEHKRLEPFVGTFKAQVKMWMGPGDPMVATGKMTNEWDLGGRYLKQTYKGDPNEGPFPDFEGRGYWGYNTIDKCYEGFWIDSASTFMQPEKGHVDAAGKVWTMSGEMTDPASGGKMRKRSMVILKDENHHTMELYFTKPDGGEVKVMEIEYERA